MLLATPVAAGEPASAVSPSTTLLHWRAPEGCPTESEFRRRVEEYLGGNTTSARAPTLADAVVVAASGGFHVTLRLVQTGQTRLRLLDSVSCVESLDAAALVVALAIDPSVVPRVPVSAPTSTLPATVPPPIGNHGLFTEPCSCAKPVEKVAVVPCPDSALPAPAPTQSLPKLAAISPQQKLGPTARPSRLEAVRAPKLEPLPASRLAFEFFQLTEVNFQRLPGLSLGLGLGAAIDYSELRVSLAAVTSDGVERSRLGGGEFRLVEGRAQVCYLSAAPLSAGPCTSVSVGALTAKGFDVDVPERKNKLWFAAGVGALLRYTPGDVAEVGIYFQAEHPFTRSYFELSGDNLYRPSALGFYAGPMLGLRFE